MNSPPYSQQHQQQGCPSQQIHGQPSHVGVPPQYAYPVHPQGHHYHPAGGYPSYPTYPQPMLMYPSARSSTHPEHSPSISSPVGPGGGVKRKRAKSRVGDSHGKSGDRGSDDETGASGSDIPRVPSAQQPHPIADLKKRTKTVSYPYMPWAIFHVLL